MRETTLSGAMRKELNKVDPVTGKTTRQVVMDKLKTAAVEPSPSGKQTARLLRKLETQEAAKKKAVRHYEALWDEMWKVDRQTGQTTAQLVLRAIEQTAVRQLVGSAVPRPVSLILNSAFSYKLQIQSPLQPA